MVGFCGGPVVSATIGVVQVQNSFRVAGVLLLQAEQQLG